MEAALKMVEKSMFEKVMNFEIERERDLKKVTENNEFSETATCRSSSTTIFILYCSLSTFLLTAHNFTLAVIHYLILIYCYYVLNYIQSA